MPQPDDIEPVELSGAEYRTLREECGLSLAEAAQFHDVREKTVKHWDRDGPPDAAVVEIAMLKARLDASLEAAVAMYRKALHDNPQLSGVDLHRYEAWSYPSSIPASEGLPHGAHNRLIARTAEALGAEGVSVSILYMVPDVLPGDGPAPDLPGFVSKPSSGRDRR